MLTLAEGFSVRVLSLKAETIRAVWRASPPKGGIFPKCSGSVVEGFLFIFYATDGFYLEPMSAVIVVADMQDIGGWYCDLENKTSSVDTDHPP